MIISLPVVWIEMNSDTKVLKSLLILAEVNIAFATEQTSFSLMSRVVFYELGEINNRVVPVSKIYSKT